MNSSSNALTYALAALLIGAALVYAAVKFGLVALILPADARTKPITEASRGGDFTGAVEKFDALMEQKNVSSVEKARAIWSVASARFEATGDMQTYLQDIELMKESIVDETVPLYIRVSLINDVASSYCASGGTPGSSYITRASLRQSVSRIPRRRKISSSMARVSRSSNRSGSRTSSIRRSATLATNSGVP